MIDSLQLNLENWIIFIAWVFIATICLFTVIRDLRKNNPEISGLMRVVWILTVSYSGPLGLGIYWFSGRKQIRNDSIWRRGWRSVAHCYSGCGAGEIIGVFVTVGLLELSNWPVMITTFVLAYLLGYALTVGPLLQGGEVLHVALWDAFTSETASITVMEFVAIGVDQLLAPNAQIGHALFWNSLVISLSCGLLAAWPVNLVLIRLGVKKGMHNPREMAKQGDS